MVLTTATYELHGLKGKLERYNGVATRCMHLVDPSGRPNPLWHIRISKKLTLELPRQFLRELSEFDFPVVPQDTWQIIMQNEEKGNHHTSNNRKDVRATMDSLVAQLRSVLAKRGSITAEGREKAIKDLFGQMDSNHDGGLDKKEFFEGCLDVGIAISPSEINLVWPVFDEDGNGFIDTDELCRFIEDRGSGRKTSVLLNDMSSKLRQDRITNKSAFAQRIKVLAQDLRLEILKVLERENMTQEEMLAKMDLDHGSTLTRTEFLGGLHRMDIAITTEEMSTLWPLFCLDAVVGGGSITKVEWARFLDPRGLDSWWDYRFTGDIFTASQMKQPSPKNFSPKNASSLPKSHGNVCPAIPRRHQRQQPQSTAGERAAAYASHLLRPPQQVMEQVMEQVAAPAAAHHRRRHHHRALAPHRPSTTPPPPLVGNSSTPAAPPAPQAVVVAPESQLPAVLPSPHKVLPTPSSPDGKGGSQSLPVPASGHTPRPPPPRSGHPAPAPARSPVRPGLAFAPALVPAAERRRRAKEQARWEKKKLKAAAAGAGTGGGNQSARRGSGTALPLLPRTIQGACAR
jgi:Ca2+-binding EF-hand superfamily protein